MKKLTKEFTQKKSEDLEKEVVALRQEIAKLDAERFINKQKDTNLVFKKRKRLAVLLTVKSQKQELENIQKEKKV